LVEKVDKNPMFKNDAVSEYFTFNEFFEELLYAFYNKPERKSNHNDVVYIKAVGLPLFVWAKSNFVITSSTILCV
jgi:hypothetical protein